MTLRKREFPLQRIKPVLRRERGQIEWISGLFSLLFLGILLCFFLQISVYRASALYLEDALAASNLAAAVIDVEEYGRSHVILVENPLEAYERFCDAVCENLQLNHEWEGGNRALISGKVRVESFIVYNVKERIVTIQEVEEGGGIHTRQGELGSVYAPNGVLIETTSIYSELSYPVEGLLGVTVTAHKCQLADIVAEYEEEEYYGERTKMEGTESMDMERQHCSSTGSGCRSVCYHAPDRTKYADTV